MTTCTPGLPVSERALRAFGHHRPSKKGASLRKEGVNFGTRNSFSYFHPSLFPLMPSKPTFRVNILSSTQENRSPVVQYHQPPSHLHYLGQQQRISTTDPSAEA